MVIETGTAPVQQTPTGQRVGDNGLRKTEFVKNFDYIKNKAIEVSSNTLPTLTMKNGGKEQPVHFLDDGAYVAQVRNGAVYNAVIDSEIVEKYSQDNVVPGKASIKDGALSLGLNRFRITGPTQTETQKILAGLQHIKDPEARMAELSKLVNDQGTHSVEGAMRLTMVNDPVRRAFESYYAKHALQDYFSSPEKYQKFSDISTRQVDYLKQHLIPAALVEKYEAAWRNESFDTAIVGLDQLQGFYTRAKKTLETLEVTPSAQQAIFDIYKHRYMSYALKNEPEAEAKLPVGHWDGVFDPIKAPGKGRVELNAKEGNLFRQADSFNVGIMRNIDATPRDLRLNEPHYIKYESDYKNQLLASASTRCPDRLEMQDPNHPDAFKPGSYLKDFFGKGTGTYVNGPSGSILIEHGALRACKDAHAQASADDIETYLAIQALLFIYIDGGHSMDEIAYALKQGSAREKLQEAFGGRDGFDKVGTKIFMNYGALEKAANDAATFSHALQVKDHAHQKITHTDPAGLTTRAQTKTLALKQTASARGVLYHPADVLIKELGAAAKLLHKVVSNLSPEHQKTLGAHLLGEGRLLEGGTTADLLAALQRVSAPELLPAGVEVSATDRAVVIALMGDIGGFYTTPANASVEMMTALNDQLEAHGVQIPSPASVQAMRDTGGSTAVGPDKRAERKVRSFESPKHIPFRAGVHNTGSVADELLNIDAAKRIPANRWAVFDISTPRIKETTEPFVGHMSASPAEILQTWDMLRGVKAKDQYVGALRGHPIRPEGGESPGLMSAQQEQRYARAAGASAFLVGLGYHSAVEVLEGTLVYTGQSIRNKGTLSPTQQDSAHVFGHGAATDLMSELFKANTTA
ncbi:hypothetical protein [Pseudomonas sp. EA_65y_Pfl1_P113]|uniref:hypothetical protein n=1 Tax=Pseudomonas sp. EA_65y_Pfl1_P113 TaxID=3088692 RepID=UPI0030DB1184